MFTIQILKIGINSLKMLKLPHVCYYIHVLIKWTCEAVDELLSASLSQLCNHETEWLFQATVASMTFSPAC